MELTVVRGLQAGREYYSTNILFKMVPKLIEKVNTFPTHSHKYQRELNKQRLTNIKKYILNNRENYVLPAITLAITGDVKVNTVDSNPLYGILVIGNDSNVYIVDGQHRLFAVNYIVQEYPQLRYESIPAIILYKKGWKHLQQVFVDINRTPVRPPLSLNIYFDHRDIIAKIVKQVISKVEIFRNTVECEKAYVPLTSEKLFSLNNIYHATKTFINTLEIEDLDMLAQQVTDIWTIVENNVLEWEYYKSGRITPQELKENYLVTTGAFLSLIGELVAISIRDNKDIESQLKLIKCFDWRKNNPEWEGLLMLNGRIVRSNIHILRTLEYIISKKVDNGNDEIS